MSRRLLRLEFPVYPDRMVFRLHDPAADLRLAGGLTPPADALIIAGRDQMVVSCAQEHLAIQLIIEEWDDAPPPFTEGYEDEAKCVLYLPGRLCVDDVNPAGRALESVRLAGGAGDYSVRVYTRNRSAAVQRFAELFSQLGSPLDDAFQRGRRELEGLEQYLVRLWRES